MLINFAEGKCNGANSAAYGDLKDLLKAMGERERMSKSVAERRQKKKVVETWTEIEWDSKLNRFAIEFQMMIFPADASAADALEALFSMPHGLEQH